MKHRYLSLISLIALIVFAGISCKKIDLEKFPAVNTVEITNITSSSATAKIEIIDFGDGVSISQGVCYSAFITTPKLDNSQVWNFTFSENGSTFTGNIGSLSNNTHYFLSAFYENSQQTVYGEVIEFTTINIISGHYLYYDNGNNNDGIGIDGGGNFNVAIRFYNADLPLGILEVTKMKFYLRGQSSTSYSLAVRTIESGMVYLRYKETISNPLNNVYGEYTLNTHYTIPSTGIEGMYFGYEVVDPDGTYPAGVDAGPNDPSGSGDLILLEGGTQWEHLTNYQLTGNWNIQVYVENTKGEEFMLTKKNGKTLVIPTEKCGDRSSKIKDSNSKPSAHSNSK